MKRAMIVIGTGLLTALVFHPATGEPIPFEEAGTSRVDGLSLAFELIDGEHKGMRDARSVRMVPLYLPQGASATPFLPPGRFRATWRGRLRLKLRDKRTFSAEGRGRLKVTINEETVLEGEGDLSELRSKVIELGKRNDLIVEYEPPAEGDAELRLLWAGEKFRPEPIPPMSLQHDENEMPVRAGRRLRQGRELLMTHRCLKCHTADTEAWLKAGGMPELGMDAPSLTDIGSRLNAEWMARWIQDPTALRPTARMPRAFPDAEAGLEGKPDQRALDLAAYLAGLGRAEKELPKPDKKTVQEGTRLFVNLGCIGCHTQPSSEEYENDDYDRVPLRDVVAKWKPAALQAFLLDPDKHYQWIRMPDFRLKPEEAAKLTSFLTSVEKRALLPEDAPKGAPERGKELLLTSGCLNCHSLQEGDKPLSSSLEALTFDKLTKAGWQKGCMSSEPVEGSKAPHFALDEEERTALLDATLNGKESLKRHSANEFAARRINALRCIACHDYDDRQSYWTELETELEDLTAGLPAPMEEGERYAQLQIRPLLTWVGEKLRPEWTVAFLEDKLAYRPRPFLRARMPAFPLHAPMLTQGMAAQHGCAPKSEPASMPDPQLAEAGRDLVSQSKWNCIGCHDIAGKKAIGVFEAPGVNFMYVRERLRHDYFERWMWGPTRVWPGTKMPTVYEWGQPSPLENVLDGSAHKQIDALWNYLLQGRDIKPPQ